jgi:hypothetical protein
MKVLARVITMEKEWTGSVSSPGYQRSYPPATNMLGWSCN